MTAICPTCGQKVKVQKYRTTCSCGTPWRKDMVHASYACWSKWEPLATTDAKTTETTES